jgi:hypothetical protein
MIKRLLTKQNDKRANLLAASLKMPSHLRRNPLKKLPTFTAYAAVNVGSFYWNAFLIGGDFLNWRRFSECLVDRVATQMLL